MVDSSPDYHAYLIRMWRIGPKGPWRVSLEDARTGEWLGFAGIAEVCAYLLWKAGGGSGERACFPECDTGDWDDADGQGDYELG